VLGRKPEAIDYFEKFLERGEKETERYPAGNAGTFNRPTDVTWDQNDNIYVSDGYNNSRVAKTDKNGTWVKAVGKHGNGANEFSPAHGHTSDGKGTFDGADPGNRRIQVYDNDLNFKKTIGDIGAPWTLCVSPGPTQYLWSGDGTGKIYK